MAITTIMKFLILLRFVLTGLLSIFLYRAYNIHIGPKSLPTFDFTFNWGSSLNNNLSNSDSIHPYKFENHDREIQNLLKQLKKPVKLHAPLEGIGFEYGVNSETFYSIIKYWKNDYLPRWSERLTFLNQFEQFQTQIQGYVLHRNII